jgi:hypothetical protein
MSRSRWLQFLWFTLYTRSRRVAPFIVLCLPACAMAFDFSDAEVTEDNGIYYIKFAAVIEAHPDYIRYVLADSEHIYRLSPSIIESEVLSPDGADDKRVRTRLLNCTPVFCLEIERVDSVRMLASGDFEAEIIPSLSEFKSGRATWKIVPMDGYSYIVYEAHLEPDFFIPPVVGKQMVIQTLKDEFATTFVNIEKIARVNASRDRIAGMLLSNAGAKILRSPCAEYARASLQ